MPVHKSARLTHLKGNFMSNNTTADVTGIFSLDTNRLVGLAAKGSPDVTYVAAQDTPTSGIPLTVTLTSDGGIGNAAPAVLPNVAGKLNLTDDVLLDLFPLPVMRPIFDPNAFTIGSITKPTSVTVSIVDAPNQIFGKALKIDLPTGLVNQKVVIPINADLRGNYPKALPKLEWHVQSDNWAAMNRLYFWACENSTGDKGYLWVINDDVEGKSMFSLKGPQAAKWNGVYRPMQTSPYFRVSKITSPTAWDETVPEYTVKSIAFTVTTTAACSIYLNRVVSPVWSRGAVTVQMDGCYAVTKDPVFSEFQKRGWGGVGSRMYYEDATQNYMTDSDISFMSRYWDITQHIAKETAVQFDATVTPDDARAVLQKWRRYASALGFLGQGSRVGVFLTNNGRYNSNDLASVLKEHGILLARGRASDLTFGIDPFDSVTTSTEWAVPCPSGFSPIFGRYNRWSVDAGDGTTADARDTYDGSNCKKMVQRCAAGADFGWTYIHRVQTYDGTFPQAGNNGPNFVASMISHLDSLTASGAVIPLSANQVHLLTHGRPGEVYLDDLGRWVYRSTGKPAI